MIVWQPGETIEEVEKNVIIKALNFYGKNKTTTAKALGIALRTLHLKLTSYQEVEDKLKKEKDERTKQRLADFEKFRSDGPEKLPLPDSMKPKQAVVPASVGQFLVLKFQNSTCKLTSIPFSIVAGFEEQAMDMFGKCLNDINQDGGLRPIDIYAITHKISLKEAQTKHTHKTAAEWLESIA